MTRIINDHEIQAIIDDNIVLAGGCFDILHPGHLEFLKKAKGQGNTLVILLESDENIKRIKGETRPVNPQLVRAKNLAKLELVDFVILLPPTSGSEYYYNLVKLLHPAIIAVTFGDPFLEDKKKQAKLVKGKVVSVMKRDPRYSTSNITNKA